MSIERRDIESRVMKVLCFQLRLDPEHVSVSSSIVNDLRADSLDVVEIVMAIEDEFDLTIQEEDSRKFDTVKDVVDYLMLKVQD